MDLTKQLDDEKVKSGKLKRKLDKEVIRATSAEQHLQKEKVASEKKDKIISANMGTIEGLKHEMREPDINFIRKASDVLWQAIKKLDKENLSEDNIRWMKNKKYL